ncbi:BUD32 family EKC/KEOPS complex subunit [Flindersiella endophytica]
MASGEVIARGRDCEIIDLGDGLVLRRALNGRSLAAEASVMAFAHAAGVPVPSVSSVTPEGAIVMERVDGPMLASLIRSGDRTPADAARIVLDMHALVNALPAPEGLRSKGLPGDRLLHLDLHVENILITARGPVLLDWANASRGPAAADLAMSWLIMCSPAPAETEEVHQFRLAFLTELRSGLDASAVASVMPAVTEWRASDRALTPSESAAVREAGKRFPDLPD